jgi:hypothetical protein
MHIYIYISSQFLLTKCNCINHRYVLQKVFFNLPVLRPSYVPDIQGANGSKQTMTKGSRAKPAQRSESYEGSSKLRPGRIWGRGNPRKKNRKKKGKILLFDVVSCHRLGSLR